MEVWKCISNVKFHTKLVNPVQKEHYLARLNGFGVSITKRKTSFVVIRDSILGNSVLCCFFSGHINVTGVKCVQDIEKTLCNISSYFGFRPSDFAPVCIDNITSTVTSAKLKSRINLFVLSKHIKTLDLPIVKKITYKKQSFPGLFIKTRIGLILWFNSNSITCVGSKSLKEVEDLHNLIGDIKHSLNNHE